MKAIIFDFDGVIHDTFEFHRRNIGEFAGLELSEQDYKDIHNGNFYDAPHDWMKSVDWAKYGSYIYDGFSRLKIKKDIKDIILGLGAEYEMHIISSGNAKNIVDYLRNNKIASLFQEVMGDGEVRSKVAKFNFIFAKHNLACDDCIFVTDTLGDILEANEVNVKTIAVDFGFHNRKTLQKGNPYQIISHLSELEEIIKNF